MLLIHCLLLLQIFEDFLYLVLISVPSTSAIISLGKRELVDLF